MMTTNKTKSGLFETPRIKNMTLKSETKVVSRSSVSDIPRAKVTPTTPRASRISNATPKADPSPHLPARLSVERSPRSPASADWSPRSVDSKLAVQQRAPKISPLSDRRPRAAKGSELQSELNAVQEQLKDAKDRLNSLESEKARAVEELEAARRLAEEANQKLTEALAARTRAEERTEIEKFRIIELEQCGIEDAERNEETWKQELEKIRNQHALDLTALHSTNVELERLKHELAMTTEAKNTAASHADDALKIAEISAGKAAKLSEEIDRLKALLDSKTESKAIEAADHVQTLKLEIEALQCELDRVSECERELIEMGAVVEGLKIELLDARRAEVEAQTTVNEWKKRAELLEIKAEEATQSEKRASESLASALAKLERCNAQLNDTESEIGCLKKTVEILETEIERYRGASEESSGRLEMVKHEVSKLETTIDELKFEIQNMEEDKNEALDHEDQMASSLAGILEEKKKLLVELEGSRNDIGKTKKAMEGLASALQEASSEARSSREQLSTEQAAITDAKVQIDESKLALDSMEERYEAMLIEAKDEVERLITAVGSSKMEAENSRLERRSREQNYSSLIRKSEEEIAAIKEEMGKMASKLIETEAEAAAVKVEGAQLMSKLMQVKFEAASANEAVEEAKDEVLRLKERLLDKENELQSITQENEELRNREESALKKIEELSMLLDEAKTRKPVESNVESNRSSVTKTVECSDHCPYTDEAYIDKTEVKPKPKNIDGGSKRGEFSKEDLKDWESCKFADDGLSRESQIDSESIGGSFRSKIANESFDQRNGQPEVMKKKKKKNLLSKFRNLLKKKRDSR